MNTTDREKIAAAGFIPWAGGVAVHGRNCPAWARKGTNGFTRILAKGGPEFWRLHTDVCQGEHEDYKRVANAIKAADLLDKEGR